MAKNDLNTVAAQGFEAAATIYEQVRPSYPNEVIDLIKSLHDKPDVVVDLGAGTGKFTRLLGSLGARELVAIEPVSSMRDNLKTIPIITKIIDGTAEHIPFPDSSIDIVVCAQAFHWFANHQTLAEVNRVLKPNGFFVLVWNTPDYGSQKWYYDITEYVDTFKPSNAYRYKTMEWKAAFDGQTFFSPLKFKQFTSDQRITRELAVNRILSISFIAALPADKKAQLVEEVHRMLKSIEATEGSQEFDVHYHTDVFWSSPLKSSA